MPHKGIKGVARQLFEISHHKYTLNRKLRLHYRANCQKHIKKLNNYLYRSFFYSD